MKVRDFVAGLALTFSVAAFSQVGSRTPNPLEKPKIRWKASYENGRLKVLIDTKELAGGLRLTNVVVEALLRDQSLVAVPITSTENSLVRGHVYEKSATIKNLDSGTTGRWRLRFTVVADGMFFRTMPVYAEECCNGSTIKDKDIVLPNNEDPLTSFSIPYYTIGLLYGVGQASSPLGSAFVFEASSFLLTANHLLETGNQEDGAGFVFSPIKGIVEGKTYRVRVSVYKRIPECDIAVLKAEGVVPWIRPLARGSVERIQKAELLPYGGYDVRMSTPTNASFSIGIGRILEIIDTGAGKLVRMEGGAVPGFSGGPVFAGAESVIGVIVRGSPKSESESSFEAASVSCVPSLRE